MSDFPGHHCWIDDAYRPAIIQALCSLVLLETFVRLLRGTIIALKISEKCSFTPCKLRFFANFCLILAPLMTPCKGLC